MTSKTLRQQFGKRDAFDSVEQEAMLSIMRTSDLLENRLARLLREYALTPSQYNAMRIMRGEARPLPCLEVAERMIQVAPAITRVVDQLVARDLVRKERSPDDGRVFLVQLTATGKRLLKKLDKPISDLHQSLLGGVPERDLKRLTSILQTTRTSIGE